MIFLLVWVSAIQNNIKVLINSVVDSQDPYTRLKQFIKGIKLGTSTKQPCAENLIRNPGKTLLPRPHPCNRHCYICSSLYLLTCVILLYLFCQVFMNKGVQLEQFLGSKQRVLCLYRFASSDQLSCSSIHILNVGIIQGYYYYTL